VTFRTGWVLAGTIALALVTGSSAYAQKTDAQSSASRKVDTQASASEQSDAQSSDSRADALSTASSNPDAVASASRKSAGFVFFELYDFVAGPLLIAACLIFAAGFAWRIGVLSRISRPVRAGPPPSATARAARNAAKADDAFLMGGMSPIGRLRFRARRWIRGTVFSTSPTMGIVSLVFHVGLFLVPLLLPAHSVLLRQSVGFGLPTLPDPLMDRLTLVLLAIGAFFLVRRIVFPRVRALTTIRDYLVILLVAAPFLTAYAAYHQWLDYRTVVVVHMLTGEVLIAAIPFTKLAHMPFLVFSRFFLSAERSWRPADRRW